MLCQSLQSFYVLVNELFGVGHSLEILIVVDVIDEVGAAKIEQEVNLVKVLVPFPYFPTFS